MRFLDLKDVVRLLRSEVERAGGQTAWAKKTGIERAIINRALNGLQRPTKPIILALKLRTVFVLKRESSHSK
jgi:DNA-binding phage protein